MESEVKITASKAGLNRMEVNIAPPMTMAITVPLLVDGAQSPYILYVCTGLAGRAAASDLVAISRDVVDAIGAAAIDVDDPRSSKEVSSLSDERFADLAGRYLARDEVLDALINAAPAAAPLVSALVERLRRKAG